MARILAREVNQLESDQDLASYMDITEIDAASNRGIDEIRTLRDTISSAPSQLSYKVYIIDEAHMLTREAFNALLKTLEEPPAHVIFILATTESHKLPATIISRTQRYDFRPISEADLVEQLSQIAKKEKILVSHDALEAIAQVSRGGFRDAIGLLDQLSVLEGEITSEQVAQFLGRVTSEQLAEIIADIKQQKTGPALEKLAAVLARGYDGQVVTQQLTDILRSDLLRYSSQDDASSRESLRFTAGAAEVFTQALRDFKTTQHPSLPLELALVAISTPAEAAQPSELPQAQPRKHITAKPAQTAAKAAESVVAKPKVDQDSQRLCTKALSLIKEHNNSLYAVLRSSQYRMEGDSFVVSCRFSFHKERIEEPRNRTLIEKAMTKTFGRPIELRCEAESSQKKAEAAPADTDSELVSSAIAILGGELVDGE